jgi:hypothetical protein
MWKYPDIKMKISTAGTEKICMALMANPELSNFCGTPRDKNAV